MADDPEREDALAAITEIARRHGLTAREISAHLERVGTADRRGGTVLGRLLGYLGAMLAFAGLSLYTGMRWSGLSGLERILITLGPGLVAYLLAIACLRAERHLPAAAPLFLIAGVLQPTGLLVAYAELSVGGNGRWALLLVLGIMLVSAGLTFWQERRGVLLFLLLVYAAGWLATAFELLGVAAELNALAVGGFLLAAGYGVSGSRHAASAGFWYFLGSALTLGASFELLRSSAADVLFLGIACFLVYLSLAVRSRALLFNGTQGVLCFLGYYTAEYFADVGGWPLALLALGLILLALSRVAMTLDRRYIRGRDQA